MNRSKRNFFRSNLSPVHGGLTRVEAQLKLATRLDRVLIRFRWRSTRGGGVGERRRRRWRRRRRRRRRRRKVGGGGGRFIQS